MSIQARWISFMAAVLGIIGAPAIVLAQQPPNRAADEAAVRKAEQDYVAAMKRGDAKALAEMWAPEGTYTDERGAVLLARELIARDAAGNASGSAFAKLSDATIRFLSDDRAVLEGNSETQRAGTATPIVLRFISLWIRQNGKWKLESIRETRPPSATNVSEYLAVLEPFVGEWSATIGPNTVHVSAKWNPTKTFLRRERSIQSEGKQVFGGTQEIGWDPVSQKIKSWVFNSDGSTGEGLWSLEGNSWIVLTTTTLPDGRTSSATQVWKFTNKNTIVWKSIHGDFEGESTPDFEITLQRQAPKK
jgi:uncharacterized protein (TIGR02246 family)